MRRYGKLVFLSLIVGCLAAGAWAGEDETDRRVVTKIVISDDGTTEVSGDHVWLGHHGHHFAAGKGGFLGVQLTGLTPELRTHFGAPEEAGVMVSKVVDDSPASRAGIAVGDIISAVDGEAVSSGSGLARAIRDREDGEAVDLEIWRDGRLEVLTATIEERATHARHFRIHRGHELDFDCGGDERCAVEIQCTANGEVVDCKEIHGFHE